MTSANEAMIRSTFSSYSYSSFARLLIACLSSILFLSFLPSIKGSLHFALNVNMLRWAVNTGRRTGRFTEGHSFQPGVCWCFIHIEHSCSTTNVPGQVGNCHQRFNPCCEYTHVFTCIHTICISSTSSCEEHTQVCCSVYTSNYSCVQEHQRWMFVCECCIQPWAVLTLSSVIHRSGEREPSRDTKPYQRKYSCCRK